MELLIAGPVAVLESGDPAARCAGFLPTGGGDLLLLLVSCCDSCDSCDTCDAVEAPAVDRGVVGRDGRVRARSRPAPENEDDDPDVFGPELFVCLRGGGGGGGVSE